MRAKRVNTKIRRIVFWSRPFYGSASLEGVDEGFALVLGRLQLGYIVAVDEDAADGSGDEGKGD